MTVKISLQCEMGKL